MLILMLLAFSLLMVMVMIVVFGFGMLLVLMLIFTMCMAMVFVVMIVVIVGLVIPVIIFLGHVTRVGWGLAAIEDGGIVTAMKVNVRLDEEMVSEQAAAVTEQDFHQGIRIGAPTPPDGASMQDRRQSEGSADQQEQDQIRRGLPHLFKGFRRNNNQAANRKIPA